jgi:hypothetical protein
VITQTRWRTAASSSSAAKPLSATEISIRLGSQRLVCRIACRAQSVSVLCRLRCSPLHRADGAITVRNGSAQCRPDQLIGATTFHTGAVKQERNTDSQAARIGGIRCGSGAVAAR